MGVQLIDCFLLPTFPPHKPVNTKKTSHQIFLHMHKILNEVYLQNILHELVVNRETNLMSLLNP